MLLKEETKSVQSLLSDYCRDGELRAIDGAKADRLPTYRRLVFNVVRDTLAQAYPITFEVLDREEWSNLVFTFFKEHNCQHTEVWKMPYELVEYVEKTQYHELINRPYLLELLYFEWLEIEIHGAEDVDLSHVVPIDTSWENIELNPYLKTIQLEYPVHKMAHGELEDNKGNYFVMIYRSISTDKVHFNELSPFSAHLLSAVQNGKKVTDFVKEVAVANRMNEDELMQGAQSFLSQMKEKEVVIGCRINH